MDKAEVLKEIKRLYFLCEEFWVLFFLSQQDDPGENYDALLPLVAKNLPPVVRKDFLTIMSEGSKKGRLKHLSEETGALHWQYADLCIGLFNEPDVLKHEEVAEGVCSLLIVLGRTALDIPSDVLDLEVRHVFRLFESYSDYFSDMNLGMAGGFFEKLGYLEKAEALHNIFEEREKFSAMPVSQIVYYNPSIDNTLPN